MLLSVHLWSEVPDPAGSARSAWLEGEACREDTGQCATCSCLSCKQAQNRGRNTYLSLPTQQVPVFNLPAREMGRDIFRMALTILSNRGDVSPQSCIAPTGCKTASSSADIRIGSAIA